MVCELYLNKVVMGEKKNLTSRIWYGSTVWTLIACPAPMPSCFPGLLRPSVESGNSINLHTPIAFHATFTGYLLYTLQK